MTKTARIKIKLPKDITVHIPLFSEISVEDVLDIVASEGKKLIYDVVADAVLKSFVKEHSTFIDSMVNKILESKEEEIKEAIIAVLSKKKNNF